MYTPYTPTIPTIPNHQIWPNRWQDPTRPLDWPYIDNPYMPVVAPQPQPFTIIQVEPYKKVWCVFMEDEHPNNARLMSVHGSQMGATDEKIRLTKELGCYHFVEEYEVKP